jgi:hypothetical protein
MAVQRTPYLAAYKKRKGAFLVRWPFGLPADHLEILSSKLPKSWRPTRCHHLGEVKEDRAGLANASRWALGEQGEFEFVVPEAEIREIPAEFFEALRAEGFFDQSTPKIYAFKQGIDVKPLPVQSYAQITDLFFERFGTHEMRTEYQRAKSNKQGRNQEEVLPQWFLPWKALVKSVDLRMMLFEKGGWVAWLSRQSEDNVVLFAASDLANLDHIAPLDRLLIEFPQARWALVQHHELRGWYRLDAVSSKVANRTDWL